MPESARPPIDPEAYSDVPRHRLWWIRCQQIGAHTLAATAFIAPLYDLDPSLDILPSLPGLSTTQEAVCAPPSEASRAAIRQLVFDPNNIQNQATTRAKNLSQADRKVFVQQTIAQALNVHVHNAAPVIESTQGSQDFAVQKKTLITFFNKFGITDVGAAKPKDLVKGWEVVADDTSQEEQLLTMLSLANTLSDLPEEYIRATGITRVVFGQNSTITNNRAHIAYVVKGTKGIADKTIVVNIGKIHEFVANDVFRHEFYHKIDERNCGKSKATDHDPHIAALAEPPPGAQGITVADYTTRVKALNEAIDWRAPDCSARVTQANTELNDLAKQTVFATSYAQQKVVELKAELFSGTNRLSPRLENVRNQLLDLLARMRDYNRPVAEYLALSQANRLVYPDLQTDTDEPNILRCE